jgi:hypothetical protein
MTTTAPPTTTNTTMVQDSVTSGGILLANLTAWQALVRELATGEVRSVLCKRSKKKLSGSVKQPYLVADQRLVEALAKYEAM